MESELEIVSEMGIQNNGTSAEPSQAAKKKTTSRSGTSSRKASTKATAQALLEEEQRKTTVALAAVEELQRRLEAIEAALLEERHNSSEIYKTLAEERKSIAETQQALAEERKGIAEAQQALTGQQPADKKGTETTEAATEATGGQTTAFGFTPFIGLRGKDIINTGQQVLQKAIQQPQLLGKHSTNFFLEMSRVLTGKSTVAPNPKDKRFADATWKTNPLYRMYLQTNLTWNENLDALINDAGLDQKDAERAHFLLSLFTEAVAPTNTLLGNPAAVKKMYETGGTSLVRGLTHMLEDLANNGGLPSQVNMKVLQVGKDLAVTPGAVVFKNEVLELIQYKPTTPQVYSRPLLITPPQVNKFYVMDLSPGKSLVQYLVDKGMQVFIISWRNPTPEHRAWDFETYDRAVLQAIDAVRAITGSEDINILAACLGGMTLATLLGHLAAQGDQRVHAATFLVTVLDSYSESSLGLFATKETIMAAKQASHIKGVIEGQELARAFAWLRPNDLIWNYWVNNYLIGNDPEVFDILHWNNDTTRLPAELHSEMLDLFENNAFAHPGMLTILGTPIDLSKVTNDTYIIAGVTDRITPWQACYATTQLLGGKCRFILSNSGHIQAILSAPGNPKAKYFINSRYPADPTQWLTGAQQRSGSWWDDYREWLGQRAGEQKPAPQELGNDLYQPGKPAPGTYVFER